jgi:hypothetical protein
MEETNLLFEVLLICIIMEVIFAGRIITCILISLNVIKCLPTLFFLAIYWPDTYIGYKDTINTRHIFFMGQWELPR